MKRNLFILWPLISFFIYNGCVTVENGNHSKQIESSSEKKFSTKCIDDECVVYDKETKLYWQKNHKMFSEFLGYIMKFSEAVKYCEELEYGGYSDWRLPTVEEAATRFWGEKVLERYYNYCNKKNASSDTTFFEKCMFNPKQGEGDNGLYMAPNVWGDQGRGDSWTSSISEKTGENIIVHYNVGTIWAFNPESFSGTRCVRKD